MGKTLITLVLLTLPGIALAATSNNTIKFQGEVAEQTCMVDINGTAKEGANKRGNSSRLTQSFHFFMFEPIFSPVNALNQPI